MAGPQPTKQLSTPVGEISAAVEDIAVSRIVSGDMFAGGTGIQDLSRSESLNVIFKNPVGSGVEAFVDLRIFVSDRRFDQDPIQVNFVPSPVEPSGMTQAASTNLKTGDPNGVAEFWWLNMRPDTIGPNPSAGSFIPLGAQSLRIDTIREVSPGDIFGMFIFAPDGRPFRGGINYRWYEEPIA